jgi:hypothetical protein
MGNWNKEIDFADLLGDFELTEDAQAFAKNASARITKFIEANQSWTNRKDITSDLEDIAENLISFSDDQSEIDCLLENLYDLADYARIWVKTF